MLCAFSISFSIVSLRSQPMALKFSSKLIFVVLLMLVMMASGATSCDLNHEAAMIENHEQWMAQYGRFYKDKAENANRYKIFKDNVEFIESFNNAGTKSYKFGINQFADLTNKEFKATCNKYKPWKVCKGTLFRHENVSVVPASMNWRKKGAITGIKDQGQRVNGTCNTNKEASAAAKITGYEDVPANIEAALLKAIANQPVSVAIDAGGPAFQFYSNRIFTSDCGTELDHGVIAVGYGTSSDGTKYWLVKNCWGTHWGENGYILMQRDIDAKEGLCGIAMRASYPTA